jgi:Cu+-exporting ATPase
VSFGLPALLLAVALILASCGGSGGSEQDEQGSGSADDMRDMDHGEMTGMDHASMGHGSSEGMQGMNMETVDPETAGVRVELTSDPTAPLPGQPVTLRYRVTDAQSGQMLTDLPIDHERPMHLIIISKDLTQFQHIHPEVGPDDAYSVTTEFTDPGTYVLYDEFVRDGQRVLDRRELPVGEASDTKVFLVPDLVPKTADSVTVALSAPGTIRAGEEASFTFTLTQGERSVTDLEPYLGAAAHVAIVSEDTEDFAHVHGEAGEADEGHEGMESMGHSPPSAFGPQVSFHHTFPHPGRYKIWGQFSHEGRVITVPYVVEVR